MEYYVEWRLRGDSYNNGYGNGHTLSQSESVREMKKLSETAEETVFNLKDKTVTAKHVKKGSVTECSTIIENNSDSDIYLVTGQNFLNREKSSKLLKL